MPRVFKGEITIIEEQLKHNITCILEKDIKINIYEPNSVGFGNMLDMLGGNIAKALNNTQKMIGSYVSYVERDANTKEFKRRNFVYGDVELAYLLLEHTAHSYLESEIKESNSYPSIKGIMEVVTYEKETVSYKVQQTVTMENGIEKEYDILVSFKEGKTVHIHLKEEGKAKVTLTKDVKYRESLFDIGDVKENAIHSQVRSLQHLRTLKDLDWIEGAIKDNKFRIVDTEEGLANLVKEIQTDFMRTGERKIYWDTEGTGLKVMNLPPDHPEKDMMAAHVISWVKERREDGYPLNIVSVTIPVGMKYVDSLDEIKTAETLRPILCNPKIGVVSHNSDYEIQIASRYDEIEGELSYNEYYKWLNKMKESSGDLAIDKEYYKEKVEELNKEILNIEDNKDMPFLLKKQRTAELRKERQEYLDKLNVTDEIEAIKNLPKSQKPYLSKIKGERLYNVNIKYDTLILSRMVNNGGLDSKGEPFFRHNLEFLSKNYLGVEQLSLDDIYGNASSSKYKIYDFSLLPREFLLYYACPDGYNLPLIEWHLERQAYNHMISLGHSHELAYRANLELLNLYYHVDVPFSKIQSRYGNYKGLGMDKETLDVEKEQQEKVRDAIINLLKELTGEEIKWTSSTQVGSLVFNKYKYPVKVYTEKENKPSYDKHTRLLHNNQTKDKYDKEYEYCVDLPEMTEDLIVDGEVIVEKDTINKMKCPISFLYQLFMDKHKDLTSFTQMIYDRTYEVNSEWIFFPNYTSTSTDTGRAAGGIMIMKASKKDLFMARKGHKLCGGDLDAAELRLIATMSQDLTEINNFKNARHDPHTNTASDVNKVGMVDVTDIMRNGAKTINFGIAYGIGAEKATQNIYPKIVPLPENLIAQTRIMMKEYSRAYPIKMNWLNKLREDTIKYGFSKTPNGRYKFFPEVNKEGVENWELKRAGRQGGNTPIQGACADFIKERIVAIFNEIEKANITRFFTFPIFVHDEFFFEINEIAFKYADNKVYTTEMVKLEQQFNLLWLYSLMYEQFTERPLNYKGIEEEAPMTLGIGIGETWKKAKSDLYGCPQELQKDLIHRYRKNRIDEDLYQNLSKDPIKTMLHQIRTWWATQLKLELEKNNVDINNLPLDIENYVDDLFIKRNLKDIFNIKEETLEEMGIPKKWFLGQCTVALKYLTGEKVNIIDVHNQDKSEGIEELVYADDTVENNVTSLEEYRALKKFYKSIEGGVITEYDRENIESAYASVFKESSLMRYNRFMAFEETGVFEFNIRYLTRDNVVELEKLIRRYDSQGDYKVAIVVRDDGSIFNTNLVNTTYTLPVTVELLQEVLALYTLNDNQTLEREKELARYVAK